MNCALTFSSQHANAARLNRAVVSFGAGNTACSGKDVVSDDNWMHVCAGYAAHDFAVLSRIALNLTPVQHKTGIKLLRAKPSANAVSGIK